MFYIFVSFIQGLEENNTKSGGHPKTQTMQTADRRPCRPCRLCKLRTFFFLILVFAFTFDSHIFWFCSSTGNANSVPMAVLLLWRFKLRVVPLSLSPSCVTHKKTSRKKLHVNIFFVEVYLRSCSTKRNREYS